MSPLKTGLLADSKIVNFVYLQNRSVELSVELSVGALKKDSALGANLVLKYNADFDISMSSKNGGRLKHSDGARFVPYIVKVNGFARNASHE